MSQNDVMKGWKGGEIIPESVLKRLSSRLNRNRVSIVQKSVGATASSELRPQSSICTIQGR
jgi:hypothetical protein